MAKATVTLSCTKCGKAYEQTKTCRNRKEADEWASWIEKHPPRYCPDCYREQVLALEAEKAARATAELPALEGTPRQIDWSTVIRAKAVESLDSIRDDSAEYDAFRAWVLGHTTCRWWIDHRNHTMTLLVGEYWKEKES